MRHPDKNRDSGKHLKLRSIKRKSGYRPQFILSAVQMDSRRPTGSSPRTASKGRYDILEVFIDKKSIMLRPPWVAPAEAGVQILD